MRAEHGEAECAGDLLGDVDDPRAEPGVGRRDVGHRDREQRHERAADAQADGEVGEEDRREEGRMYAPAVLSRPEADDHRRMPSDQHAHRAEAVDQARRDAERQDAPTVTVQGRKARPVCSAL